MSYLGNKTRVAVLRGGPSEEYEVSLQTGAGVITALKDRPFDVQDILITKNGEWLQHGVSKEPRDILATIDVVFIALHGAYGEDGTVQRVLDRFGVPYTGSKPFSSALAMNKMLTKEHVQDSGIKTAPHLRVTKDSVSDLSRIVHTISNLFGPEYVVKPTSGGSSIGAVMASTPHELYEALSDRLETYGDLLVEKRIRGREATCGVLENFRNERIYRLPAIEIVPPHSSSFFSADVKYTGETEEICPGRFSNEEKKKLENMAHQIHEMLGLTQYSRSDFIVADDDIYFLEVNTLPGLTQQSLYPKSLEAIGCSYSDFLNHLLTDALERRSS